MEVISSNYKEITLENLLEQLGRLYSNYPINEQLSEIELPDNPIPIFNFNLNPEAIEEFKNNWTAIVHRPAIISWAHKYDRAMDYDLAEKFFNKVTSFNRLDFQKENEEKKMIDLFKPVHSVGIEHIIKKSTEDMQAYRSSEEQKKYEEFDERNQLMLKVSSRLQSRGKLWLKMLTDVKQYGGVTLEQIIKISELLNLEKIKLISIYDIEKLLPISPTFEEASKVNFNSSKKENQLSLEIYKLVKGTRIEKIFKVIYQNQHFIDKPLTVFQLETFKHALIVNPINLTTDTSYAQLMDYFESITLLASDEEHDLKIVYTPKPLTKAEILRNAIQDSVKDSYHLKNLETNDTITPIKDNNSKETEEQLSTLLNIYRDNYNKLNNLIKFNDKNLKKYNNLKTELQSKIDNTILSSTIVKSELSNVEKLYNDCIDKQSSLSCDHKDISGNVLSEYIGHDSHKSYYKCTRCGEEWDN